MQPDLRRNELRSVFSISSSSCTATHDIVGDVMNLLAVLLEDCGTGCRTRIGAKYYATLKDNSGNRRSCFTSRRCFVAALKGSAYRKEDGSVQSRIQTYFADKTELRMAFSKQNPPRADSGVFMIDKGGDLRRSLTLGINQGAFFVQKSRKNNKRPRQQFECDDC